MEFVRAAIVGSGSSSSTPSLSCILSRQPCAACSEAAAHPTTSRNHRLNPSFLLELRHPSDGTLHHVLIDCGKTFREAALKSLKSLEVRDLSAVLLTHAHADAAYGVDDLREFNRRDDLSGVLPVYADAASVEALRGVFPYLFPKDHDKGSRSGWSFNRQRQTWTAALDWRVMASSEVTQVPIYPRLPVEEVDGEQKQAEVEAAVAPWPMVAVTLPHGNNVFAQGFVFLLNPNPQPASSGGAAPAAAPRFLFYLSDVSVLEGDHYEVLAAAQHQLLGACRFPKSSSSHPHGLLPIECLILDMMSFNTYISHLSVDQAIAAAQVMRAERTYFIGMSHTLEYKAMNELLRERGVGEVMTMGYDGCVVAGEGLQWGA